LGGKFGNTGSFQGCTPDENYHDKEKRYFYRRRRNCSILLTLHKLSAELTNVIV
jgi:hypothetical protein